MNITYAEDVKPSIAPELTDSEELEGAQKQLDQFAAALGKLRPPKTRSLTTREVKRLQRRDGRAQTKKATRNWRRSKIDALQNQATVLGLARVHLLKQGSPAMQRNVTAHVEKLVDQIVVSQDLSHGDAYDTLVEHFRSALELVGEKVPA